MRVTFTGLFENGWASLTHAYGPTEDVPQILLNLASDDPDEREIALDQFLGAVHHQGDVYDSTVACLPFLFELVADPTMPGRGAVAELFTSFGESTDGSRQMYADSDAAWRGPYRQAAQLIRSRADEFETWLADADPQVRSAAAVALAYFAPQPAYAVELFAQQLTAEPEVKCRIALIKAAADIAVSEPQTADRVADRIGLTVDQLNQPDPGRKVDALRKGSQLIARWRRRTRTTWRPQPPTH